MEVKFVARVRRRGKVWEITIPPRVIRQLGLRERSIVEILISKIIYVPEPIEKQS